MKELAGPVPSPRGGTWNRDGIILFANVTGPIFRVLATGADKPVAVTHPEGGANHKNPQFLPDGRNFVFYVPSAQPENAGIYVGNISTLETRRLVYVNGAPAFVSSGQLFFVQNRTLLAQSFDAERMQLTGNPVSLAEDVTVDSTLSAAFSVSATGFQENCKITKPPVPQNQAALQQLLKCNRDARSRKQSLPDPRHHDNTDYSISPR